jgi:flagellar basal-body rod protein FlgC
MSRPALTMKESRVSIFDTMRISGSGLTAERLRMDVAASNLANAQTTRTASGGAYRQESVVFSAQQVASAPASVGVAAVAILTPGATTNRVYDPSHPDADANGFVTYPNVDTAAQITDLMGASRAYSVNATAAQAAKQSALDALELGR